jgi:hypothetical protein
LLVLATFTAVAPAEARAGCTHPWVKSGDPHTALFDLAVLDPGSRALVPQPGSLPLENPPSPCKGGACSRSPDRPASWPPSVLSPGQLWADLPDGIPSVVPQIQQFSPENGLLPTSLSVSLLERPPRRVLAR